MSQLGAMSLQYHFFFFLQLNCLQTTSRARVDRIIAAYMYYLHIFYHSISELINLIIIGIFSPKQILDFNRLCLRFIE